MPHLLKLFLSPDEISNRQPTLLLLTDLINAARDSMSGVEGPEEDGMVPLMPYKDEVLGAMSAGLREIALRRTALTGIMGMITTKKLFSDEELRFIVHIVTQALQEDDGEDGDDVRSLCANLLSCSMS
jgi:DNA repair/transcription protein MET18/MMS19